MIFSLVVIVCEGQTLFAPHYTTYGGTSLVASDTTNSLVPVAGVNMSIPLAGSSENGFVRYPPLVKPKHDSPSFVTSNVDLASTPADGVNFGVADDMPFMDLPNYTGDQETSEVWNYDVSYEKGAYPNRNQYTCHACGLCGD